jgi:hypothetical protein
MPNLALKEIVALAFFSSTLEKLGKIVNYFNVRKCIFLPLLHTHMRDVYAGKVYALLTFVATRFYSRVTAAKLAPTPDIQKLILGFLLLGVSERVRWRVVFGAWQRSRTW